MPILAVVGLIAFRFVDTVHFFAKSFVSMFADFLLAVRFVAVLVRDYGAILWHFFADGKSALVIPPFSLPLVSRLLLNVGGLGFLLLTAHLNVRGLDANAIIHFHFALRLGIISELLSLDLQFALFLLPILVCFVAFLVQHRKHRLGLILLYRLKIVAQLAFVEQVVLIARLIHK